MSNKTMSLLMGLIGKIVAPATENFATWTEVDPLSKTTVSTPSVVGVGIETLNSDAYVYKDFGAGFFSGVITADFETSHTSPMGNSARLGVIGFTNSVGVFPGAGQGVWMSMWQSMNAAQVNDQNAGSAFLGNGLLSGFWRLTITKTGGWADFGVITLSHYPTAARVTPDQSVSLNIETQVPSWRYCQVLATAGGLTPGRTITQTISNLLITQS